jgi:hypothetical protein
LWENETTHPTSWWKLYSSFKFKLVVLSEKFLILSGPKVGRPLGLVLSLIHLHCQLRMRYTGVAKEKCTPLIPELKAAIERILPMDGKHRYLQATNVKQASMHLPCLCYHAKYVPSSRTPA